MTNLLQVFGQLHWRKNFKRSRQHLVKLQRSIQHHHCWHMTANLLVFCATVCKLLTSTVRKISRYNIRIWSLLNSTVNRFEARNSWVPVEEVVAVGAPTAVQCSQTLSLGSCSPRERTSFLWRRDYTAAERPTAAANHRQSSLNMITEYSRHSNILHISNRGLYRHTH